MFGKRKNELTPEEQEKVNKKFDSFKNKKYSEKEMGEDYSKVVDNEENIMNKMKDHNLSAFIDDVKIFFMMIKDFFTRKYTQVPVGTIIAIVCTLLYILAPIDVIPDWLPVAGYLDDAGVLGLCLNFVKNDVDKYKEFKGIK